MSPRERQADQADLEPPLILLLRAGIPAESLLQYVSCMFSGFAA